MNELILRSIYKETQDLLGIHYCYYGCGKLASYKTIKRNHYLCSKNPKACSSLRLKISKGVKESGYVPTIEQRLKISLFNKGKIISPETRKKISIAISGSKNYLFGKHLSQETKNKISKANSGTNSHSFGKHLSEETKKKISKFNLGFKRPEYVKKKISESMKGKKKSLLHRENISRNRKCNGHLWKGIKSFKKKNISGDIFNLQGTWELKMAEFLNSKNILWIKGKRIEYFNGILYRNYYPDFYLPELNSYIEVKGYYPENCKLKMKFVQEQNPVKIIMAFKEDIYDLDKFLERITP